MGSGRPMTGSEPSSGRAGAAERRWPQVWRPPPIAPVSPKTTPRRSSRDLSWKTSRPRKGRRLTPPQRRRLTSLLLGSQLGRVWRGPAVLSPPKSPGPRRTDYRLTPADAWPPRGRLWRWAKRGSPKPFGTILRQTTELRLALKIAGALKIGAETIGPRSRRPYRAWPSRSSGSPPEQASSASTSTSSVSGASVSGASVSGASVSGASPSRSL